MGRSTPGGPVARRRRRGRSRGQPVVYETIAFDFHFEPIAALFCVLVGYKPLGRPDPAAVVVGAAGV